jgi:hypothetical protein
VQRISAAPFPVIRETCPFFATFPLQTGPQRTDCPAAKVAVILAFLRKAHAQSGFKQGIRRMQCDQKPGIQPLRVDFVSILESDSGASHMPVSGLFPVD